MPRLKRGMTWREAWLLRPRHPPCLRPADRVLQPVVAPEQLAPADHEGWRAKDAERLGAVGLRGERLLHVVARGAHEHPRRILPDRAQRIADVRFAAGLMTELKPLSIGFAHKGLAPALLHTEQRDLVSEDRLFRWIRRGHLDRNAVHRRAPLDVA